MRLDTFIPRLFKTDTSRMPSVGQIVASVDLRHGLNAIWFESGYPSYRDHQSMRCPPSFPRASFAEATNCFLCAGFNL